jgi:hypothetical protein
MKVSSLATLAAAVVALGASIAACGSTTNNNAPTQSSALGESCSQTADCKSGLVCIALTCVMGPATSTGDGGSEGGGSSSGASSGGSSGGSGSGSSSGSAVPEAAPPHLGARGDVCQATSECGPGLECVSSPSFGGGGICDISSYGLSGNVTGKTCTGECNTAADCCDLPVDKYTVGATVIHQCADLTTIINGQTCPSAGDTSLLGQACFLNATYCGTCGTSWTCTANQCIFTAACNQSNVATPAGVGGCAEFSRLGHPLTETCNPTTSTCTTPTSTTGCTQATDCTNESYVAFTGATAGICKAPGGSGDCVCQNTFCYLACSKDLDCATGYTCDTTSRLCKPVGACTSNAQCVTTTGDVLSTCVSGKCTEPCTSDHDCSQYSGAPGADQGGFGNSVCVIPSGMTTGTCQALTGNCSTDSDCNLANGATAHLFCVTPSTTTPAPVEVSAITN